MQNIDDNLQKFWEIETTNEGQKPLSKEEEYCENHYQVTHTRNEAGRYVQVPVKDIQGLGHSKGLAMKGLDQLWRRLSKYKQMENVYREFMQQYLDFGHMEKVEEQFDETHPQTIFVIIFHID
ncbi:uncharacterized protein TNCV_238781 [Trichonephila clavipes]|nr:uncharacterized protein TNCV_238781 [Trichonephila clavipes]